MPPPKSFRLQMKMFREMEDADALHSHLSQSSASSQPLEDSMRPPKKRPRVKKTAFVLETIAPSSPFASKKPRFPSSNQAFHSQSSDKLAWVCCERCEAWHTLPSHVPMSGLPDKWFCEMCSWDPSIRCCGKSHVRNATIPKKSPERKEPRLGVIAVGTVVKVAKHVRKKKESQGGVGRVVRIVVEMGVPVAFDVEYVLHRCTECEIPKEFVSVEKMDGQTAMSIPEEREMLSIDDPSRPVREGVNWVWRSQRHAGGDQMARPDLQDLMDRLEKDDPKDTELIILRLKNWLEADTNTQVMTRVFELLAKSNVVQALYVQNMEKGMDDDRLALLSRVLKTNHRIWALNVGENFKISRQGWENFANNLKDTGLTHLYAGSESTVHGELKVQMRDAIRDNRSKHNLHIAVWNLEIIVQIGQMWWNPRNSAVVQAGRRSELEGREPSVVGGGSTVYTIDSHVLIKLNGRYSFVRIVDVSESAQCLVEVLATVGKNSYKLGKDLRVDFDDSKYSVSTIKRVGLAKASTGMSWPVLYFPELFVVVWIDPVEIRGELRPRYLAEEMSASAVLALKQDQDMSQGVLAEDLAKWQACAVIAESLK